MFKEDAAIERTTYKMKEKYRVTIHHHFRWRLRGRVKRRKYTELIIEDRSIPEYHHAHAQGIRNEGWKRT